MDTLKSALRSNAAFSALCAASIATLHAPLIRLFGAPHQQATAVFVWALVIGLLLFSGWILWVVQRPGMRGAAVWISAADLAWVLSSAAVLLFPPAWLTLTGRWLIAGIAVAVLLLALWQLAALRSTHRKQTMA